MKLREILDLCVMDELKSLAQDCLLPKGDNKYDIMKPVLFFYNRGSGDWIRRGRGVGGLIHDSVFTVSPTSDTIGIKPLVKSTDKCRKCWLLGPRAILVGL